MFHASVLIHAAVGPCAQFEYGLLNSDVLGRANSPYAAADLHFRESARAFGRVGAVLVFRPAEPHDSNARSRWCDLVSARRAIIAVFRFPSGHSWCARALLAARFCRRGRE